MIWIFPYIRKRLVKKYRDFLRFLFWGISQKLKRLKTSYFAMSI